MKTVRVILTLAMLCLFVGQASATENAFIAFDQVQQKMHLVVESDVPMHGLVSFGGSAIGMGTPQVWNPATNQYVDQNQIDGATVFWCQVDVAPGSLPVGQPVDVQGMVEMTDENGVPTGNDVVVEDWNSLVNNGQGELEYLQTCTPVLPTSIPVNSSFCAHLCHGSYMIPIECESEEYTPGTVEVTVTNRCNPSETHCDEDCQGINWGLFTYEIRVFPGCLIYLTMTYCGQDDGCICIWRSDTYLPVEISSFDAVALDGRVRLNWSTASESDLREFRITRSTTRDGVYEELYDVNASNQAAGNNYSWTDTHVQNGTTYYYKLHVEDVEGHLSVYNISGQTVVAEATPTAGIVPSEFSLAQNYPNPFNSQTTFSFTLPEAGDVSLKVYDMLGREVATVAEGAMSSGVHTMNWSADGLATGVYMYTLKSGEFSQSKKLMYLK
ncbi:T9SS type A sorting domain-containing protein [bacterium]|nr:T9SS type A sorting domain-containing protein [bacterium]